MHISILGAGAWGTAMAIALARRHPVTLWGRDAQAMQVMAEARENAAYLRGHAFPDTLSVTADFAQAVGQARGPDGLVIAACPVAGLRTLATQLLPFGVANLVWLCKGFEEDTGKLPHVVVAEALGATYSPAADGVTSGGALSGPSFAQEVARGLPCALTIASDSAPLRDLVVRVVHGGNLRVYASDDLVGVEVGGAVKNIMAIATGVADGLGLGLNARAALMTRGLAEISRLGVALGGVPATFMGLSGVGDLILTCTGDLSRNRQVGLGLAQGKPLDAIVAELGHVAEGVRCARAVRALAQQAGVDMPITNAVAGVLFDGDSAQHMAQALLARDPRRESL
jgi:glycerol-3-phosphate dehydrogenase (NAD(P)+)